MKNNKLKYRKYGNKTFNSKTEAEIKKNDVEKKGFKARLYYNPHTKKYEILVVDENKVKSKNSSKQKSNKKYHVEWESQWTDRRKHGKPFFAVVSFNKDDMKLEREFINGFEDYNKNSIKLDIDTYLKKGIIIDTRSGGSWKNDYRYWYVVDNNDKPKNLIEIEKKDAVKYLRGKISLVELKKLKI